MGLRSKKTGEHRHLKIFLALLATFIVVNGCGYRFQRQGRSILEESETIGIEKIYNLTEIKSGNVILEEKLKEEIVLAGLPIVFDGECDYIIRGEIRKVDEVPVGFSPDRFGLEYEISIDVAFDLISRLDGESFIGEKVVTERATYYSGTDSSYTRTNRDRAIETTLEKVARHIARILQGLQQ